MSEEFVEDQKTEYESKLKNLQAVIKKLLKRSELNTGKIFKQMESLLVYLWSNPYQKLTVPEFKIMRVVDRTRWRLSNFIKSW